MPFFSGKGGSVTVGGFAKPLTEWSVDIKTEEVDVTNFTSSGWRELYAGIYAVDVSASGPYDGDSKITQGTAATFVLGTGGAGPSFTVSALVTSVKIDHSIKDVAKITYTAISSGSVTISP